jgi:hypothetical protein
MLEIRPNCECCDKDLVPESTEAMICSYECTFCNKCVEEVLENVCPNCAGGFMPRPARPKVARRAGISIEHQPASKNRVNIKYSTEEITDFSMRYKQIESEQR